MTRRNISGLPELAGYVLAKAERNTSRAEDRTRYRSHLAAAAVIFECLHRGDLVYGEDVRQQRTTQFRVGLPDADAGATAESAFTSFAAFLDRL